MSADMEEAGERERDLFLKREDAGAKKDRAAEVRYELSKRYEKEQGAPVDAEVVLVAVCDHLLVITVVTVNVVGFWRGLFGILSQLEDLYQLCFVYLLGSLIVCHFTMAREVYKRHLNRKNIYSCLLRRGYTYVFGCACVAQWAGLWYFLDAMSGFEVYPPLAYSVICSAILIYIKLYRNVLAPPITFCTDHSDDFFEFKTVFNIDPSAKHPGHPKAKNEPPSKIVTPRMRSGKSGPDSSPGGPNRFLSVLDAVLSGVVIAPTVVAYWRGTWGLSDLYVFPQDLRVSLIASAVVGTVVQVAFALLQECLQRRFHPQRHRILFYVTSRLYTYVFSIASVNLWRGGWKLLDLYSGTEFVQVTVATAVSLSALVGMKAMRNLSSAPLAIVLDTPGDYFYVPTMFKLMGTSVTSLYVLDCFFSVFVIGTLVVFVWRGIWCLIDVFLYPENDEYSAFGSLAIGYGIVVIVFSVQIPMESFCEKLTGFRRLLVADVYVFVSFIGTINLWRGIWNLLNIYFLPESPILSCWITHFGSFVLLALIQCSNSTLARGVYLDGEEGGKCVVFPISYLRSIFKKCLTEDETKAAANHKINSSTDTCEGTFRGPKENPENGKTFLRSADPPQEAKM